MRVGDLDVPQSVKEVLARSGIVELYPPQEEAVKAGALEGRNLVLASPTASGKTLVAELCALKRVVEGGGRALYLTPLRALAAEKYAGFKKYELLRKVGGGRVRVGISTGDYDSSDPKLARYDILICTNEKADSLLRHRASWMDEVTLVVADEVHLLNDGDRGPTLEVTLTRLRQAREHAQVLALSATVKNASEVARWLGGKAITTNWRPVKLREGVLLGDRVEFGDGTAYKIEDVGSPALSLAYHTVKQGDQALIFEETRKKAVRLAERAAALTEESLSAAEQRHLRRVAERMAGVGERTRLGELLARLVEKGSAFHHAGLSGPHRRAVEDAFRGGKIKILVATPTLAAGVNLPARTVIIRSYSRYAPGYGQTPITVLEYKQMAGRAGRPNYDEVGEAVLVARSADERAYLWDYYVRAEPERLWSKLGSEGVLRSHVLATVATGFAHTEEGVVDFFKRTFFAFQNGPRRISELVSGVLRFLEEEGMVRKRRRAVVATSFGRRVSELYIDPVSAVVIRDGLLGAREKAPTDTALIHLICRCPDMAPKLYPRRRDVDKALAFLDQHRGELLAEVPDEGLDPVAYGEFLAEVNTAMVIESWINEESEDAIIERHGAEPGDLYRITESAKWLLYSARELAKLFGERAMVPAELLPALSSLEERVGRGVKAELLPLVRLEGVGRVKARILFDRGYRTLGDLKRASLGELMSVPLIGSATARSIKEQVGGTVSREDWERAKSEWRQSTLADYRG